MTPQHTVLLLWRANSGLHRAGEVRLASTGALRQQGSYPAVVLVVGLLQATCQGGWQPWGYGEGSGGEPGVVKQLTGHVTVGSRHGAAARGQRLGPIPAGNRGHGVRGAAGAALLERLP